jgi:hypothetical protein
VVLNRNGRALVWRVVTLSDPIILGVVRIDGTFMDDCRGLRDSGDRSLVLLNFYLTCRFFELFIENT